MGIMKRTALHSFSLTGAFVAGLLVVAGLIVFVQNSLVVSSSMGVMAEGDLAEATTRYDYAAGIVPHHLLAESIIAELVAELAESEPTTIVLVSPDHWGRAGNYFVTTAGETYQDLAVDTALRNTLVGGDYSEWLALDDELLLDEHGLNNLIPYLKNALPEVKIVPLAVSAAASENQVAALARQIDLMSSSSTVVLASVDFSHYLPERVATLHDLKTSAAIENFEFASLADVEVDCPMCLSLAMHFAADREAFNARQLAHSNSDAIIGAATGEVTSYASYLFRDQEPAATNTDFSLLFVGDTMLGRHVETLMRTQGNTYPFELIEQALRGVDLLIANLEGPITSAHVQTPDFSTSFDFASSVADVLTLYGFDIVSLANNHTLDQGASNYNYTREILDEHEILHAGHATQIADWSRTSTEVRGTSVEFIAVNLTFPYSERDSAFDLVAEAAQDPEALVIVNVHWGQEYVLTSNQSQQEFAHALVDAGADVVIGHHPHVVQEIETYMGKLIFYSLGNFIFDQYWSSATQQGLAVGLAVADDELTFTLLPLQSVRSQPSLMTLAQTSAWLEDLATRSSSELQDQIKSGIILMKQ